MQQNLIGLESCLAYNDKNIDGSDFKVILSN